MRYRVLIKKRERERENTLKLNLFNFEKEFKMFVKFRNM